MAENMLVNGDHIRFIIQAPNKEGIIMRDLDSIS